MAHRILKQSETTVVVKVWGTGSTDTIAIATEFLSPTMIVSGTPTANIIFATWAVSAGAADIITVTRNSIPVFNLYQNGQFDLGGNFSHPDDTGNTSDTVVTITGTGVIYLTYRKVAGWKSKIEPETYGPYDNPAAVGA